MRIALFLSLMALAAHAKDIWDEAVLPPPVSSIAESSSLLPLSSVAPVSSSSDLVPQSSAGQVSSSIDVSSSSMEGSSSSVGASSSSMEGYSSSIGASSSTVPLSSFVVSSSSRAASSSSFRSRKDLLGPVKVSRVRGIDEMKGRYKSPRKALFLSLALPGAGQMYVGGSTFNYVRGGLYMVTEAVLGGLWYHYSVTLYDRQVKKYEKYAKAHYSVGRYESEMYSLYGQLADADERSEFETQYLSGREAYCAAIYKTPTNFKCSEKDLRKGDDHRRQFPVEENLGTSLDKLNFHDETEFFQTIGTEHYVFGWDDVTDQASANDLILDKDASEWVRLGSSENRDEYLDLRDRANKLAGYQAYFLGGIILNHIISAVDATWSAHAHNKGLYEEKLVWYDRIRFDSQLLWGGDIGSQVTARLDF